VYARLPKAFTVVPLAAERVPRRRREATRPDAIDARPARGSLSLLWLRHSTIWRGAIGNWMWLYVPVIVLHGFVLSDTTYEPYFAFYFLTVTILASWSMVAMRGLYRFDPLPVRRSRLLASVVLPPVAAAALGYGLGAAVLPLLVATPREAVSRSEACRASLLVPDERWAISWNGTIPQVSAPSGERFVPRGHPLFRGSRIQVYDPFEAPCEGSPELVASQLRRAIAALHGASLTESEIRGRYLETAPDGTVRLRDGGALLFREFPAPRRSAGSGILLADLLLAILPWLLFLALLFRTFRADVREGVRGGLLVAAFVVILSLGIGLLGAHSMGLVDLQALARFAVILVRGLGESLPGGRLALLVVTAALLAATYLWVQSLFRRTELPLAPQRR
jgi:hypothetical protein